MDSKILAQAEQHTIQQFNNQIRSSVGVDPDTQASDNSEKFLIKCLTNRPDNLLLTFFFAVRAVSQGRISDRLALLVARDINARVTPLFSAVFLATLDLCEFRRQVQGTRERRFSKALPKDHPEHRYAEIPGIIASSIIEQKPMSLKWSGLDLLKVVSVFSIFNRNLRFAQLNDDADYVERILASFEAHNRSRSGGIKFSASVIENIGHVRNVLSYIYASEAGLIPISEFQFEAKAKPGNQYLLNIIKNRTGDRNLASPHLELMGYKSIQLATGQVFKNAAFLNEMMNKALSDPKPITKQIIDDFCMQSDLYESQFPGFPNAKIATVHVREEAFDPFSKQATQMRNANINSFIPAIKHLIERGYFVIRMGDKSMHPIPPIDGFFDYPQSEYKSPMNDIVLASRTDFHLGTSSGMSIIPIIRDAPTLMTNWSPVNAMQFSARTRFLLKKLAYFDGSPVPLAEYFSKYYAMTRLEEFYSHGVSPVDNDPSEILAATSNYLDALEGGKFDEFGFSVEPLMNRKDKNQTLWPKLALLD
jgi:putative glycosyltransferase (TIGR04372 family)